MREAGQENLLRLKSALREDRVAMDALRAFGLHGGTIERLHIGKKQPYLPRGGAPEIHDALSFPLMSHAGKPLGRYAYVNLPGVTSNPPHPKAWGAGVCAEYRIGAAGAAVGVVCADVVDAWLAWQCYAQDDDAPTILSRSHWDGWPAEWHSTAHWARFERIVVLPGDGAADFLAEIAPLMGREVRRFQTPPPFGRFADMVVAGCAPPFDRLLSAAVAEIAVADDADRGSVPLGIFEAAPIDVSSGFAGGRLYYPIAVEVRAVEGGCGRVVQSYRTMVVRSDGALLGAERLPAPRGTTSDLRVLALSDGTRIRGLPPPSPSGTWSYPSIEAFLAWRRRSGPRPFRDLPILLEEIEGYLRARVWLPERRSYGLLTCFVALTFSYQLFPALPILLVLGPAASGKSELGEAVARLSLNGVLAGQLRAAGMVRLLDECRGLLVLDDMDGTGQASIDGDGEVAMALKTGYKRSTSRKPLADRGGRVRMVDYFGPKLVTRTRPPTPILGSRMVTLRTEPRPNAVVPDGRVMDDAGLDALRDELHCWAMASIDAILEAFVEVGPGDGGRRDEIGRPLLAIARCAGERFSHDVSQHLGHAWTSDGVD